MTEVRRKPCTPGLRQKIPIFSMSIAMSIAITMTARLVERGRRRRSAVCGSQWQAHLPPPRIRIC